MGFKLSFKWDVLEVIILTYLARSNWKVQYNSWVTASYKSKYVIFYGYYFPLSVCKSLLSATLIC